MSLYRDEAVVLRVQKLGEADRIVTLLTRRNGRVRAVAKGVRRTKRRFGGRLEPFSHVDLQLYTGRKLDIVTQAETLDPYGEDLVTDYPRYTAGTAMLETAERLTAEEREPALRLYLLLVGALRALADRRARPVAGARRVPAPRDGGRRLRAGAGRVRAVRRARAAPGVPRAGRRRGVPGLPARRLGHPGPSRARRCWPRCCRRLGHRGRERRRRPAARRAGWSPRTCSGTSNAGCARFRWSTHGQPGPATTGMTAPQWPAGSRSVPAATAARPGAEAPASPCSRRRRTRPAPGRRRSPPSSCRSTSRS